MHTFTFVDIVGFTTFTARWGDAEAARLAVRAGDRVRALLPFHGAEQVKCLGDGMMIHAARPADALRLAARLEEEQAAGRLPLLRIGAEAGPAVEHEGDWYGATVNRAARLCESARPGEVLVGARLREAVDGSAGFVFRRRLAGRRGIPLRAAAYSARALPEVAQPASAATGALRRLRAFACPRHAIGRPT